MALSVPVKISNYRPDIDGLRAVAVLAVIAYHFGLPLPGGFVGVDVFFVISGYVITKSIIAYLEVGTFSLLGFYDRRLRRILPGLLAVILASLVAGWVLLMPADYVSLGYQAGAAAFGASNFYFFMNSGYFDPAADMFPLLHTWSLAVEEQFYLFWPIVLALTWRAARGSATVVVMLLLAIVAMSFTASILTVETDQPAAFYMLPSRAWELAIGALLVFVPVLRPRLAGDVAALVGLSLIAYTCWTMSAEATFPGWNAVLPCIGAALIVWPKSALVTALLLGNRIMRGVGLLSYSLYLWHWPVLVFFRHYNRGELPDFWQGLALAITTFGLSLLSYFAVERPLRSRLWPERRTVAIGIGSMIAATAVSVIPIAAGGIEARLPVEARRLAAFASYNKEGLPNSCVITVKTMPEGSPPPECFAKRTGNKRVLLFGDSHAGHIAAELAKAIAPVELTIVTASGCRPVQPTKGEASCIYLVNRAYEEIIPDGGFDAVVVAARWRNGQYDRLPVSLAAISPYAPDLYVLGPIAEYPDDLPSLLAGDVSLPRAPQDVAGLANIAQAREIEAAIRRSLETGPATYISELDAQCPNDRCTLVVSGVPLQYDYSHFTDEGASFIISQLLRDGLLSDTRLQSAQTRFEAGSDKGP